MWPCFPLSSALQKCALNTTSSLKMQGTLKVKAAFFWQVSCRCTYRGVNCCRYSGQANVLSFRKPWAPALDFSCQCGRQEDNLLVVSRSQTAFTYFVLGREFQKWSCCARLNQLYVSHVFICWAVDRSQSICTLCPDRFFPFVFGQFS